MQVLDHGSLDVITVWGSDETIIEAARMSTQKGFQGWDTDGKLLAYLWKNGHLSPFEQCGMTVEVCAPIFVFREWHRHRTQSYNEASARYGPLPAVDYVPTLERIERPPETASTQQSAYATLTHPNAVWWQKQVEDHYAATQRLYDQGLDLGIPKELARIVLPVGRYSRMRASANLRNWLHFLDLRMDPAAQWEIRQYATALATLLDAHFPRTMFLWRTQ